MCPLSSEQQRTLPGTRWTWWLCGVGVVGAVIAFRDSTPPGQGGCWADLDTLRPGRGPASYRSCGRARWIVPRCRNASGPPGRPRDRVLCRRHLSHRRRDRHPQPRHIGRVPHADADRRHSSPGCRRTPTALRVPFDGQRQFPVPPRFEPDEFDRDGASAAVGRGVPGADVARGTRRLPGDSRMHRLLGKSATSTAPTAPITAVARPVVGVGLLAVVLAVVLVVALRSPAVPVLIVGLAAALVRLVQRRLRVDEAAAVLGVPVLAGLFGITDPRSVRSAGSGAVPPCSCPTPAASGWPSSRR